MAEKAGFEPARAFTPNGFRNRPLQPLGYFSRYGGEKGIRTLDRLASVPIFKTGAISQLDHLSRFAVQHALIFYNESITCVNQNGSLLPGNLLDLTMKIFLT